MKVLCALLYVTFAAQVLKTRSSKSKKKPPTPSPTVDPVKAAAAAKALEPTIPNQDIINRAVSTDDRMTVCYVPCRASDCEELPRSLDTVVAQAILDEKSNPNVQLDIWVFVDNQCQKTVENWVYQNSQHLYSTNLYIRDARLAMQEFRSVAKKWLPPGVSAYVNACAQAKFALPRILYTQNQVKKLLIIDSDTRVLKSVLPIFKSDMMSDLRSVIAMAPEQRLVENKTSSIRTKSKKTNSKVRRRRGVAPPTPPPTHPGGIVFTGIKKRPFYNSGVIYIEAQRYNDNKVLETLLESTTVLNKHMEQVVEAERKAKLVEAKTTDSEIHKEKGLAKRLFTKNKKTTYKSELKKQKAEVKIPIGKKVRSYRDFINQYADYLASQKKTRELATKLFVVLPCKYNVRHDSYCPDEPVMLHARGAMRNDSAWQEKNQLIDQMSGHVKDVRASYTMTGALKWFHDIAAPWAAPHVTDSDGKDVLQDSTTSLYDTGALLHKEQRFGTSTYGGNWYSSWGAPKTSGTTQ